MTDFFSLAQGSVVGGEFQVTQDNGVTWPSAPTGGFTIAQIEAGDVRFVRDNTGTVPNFSIWVSDGHNTSPAIAPTVNSLTITVLASDGLNFQFDSPLAGMEEVPSSRSMARAS